MMENPLRERVIEEGQKVPKKRRPPRSGPRAIARQGHIRPEAIESLSDAECRAKAVEIAADIEMGYHRDAEGNQWPAQSANPYHVIRAMGYSPNTRGWLPVWFPSLDQFRRMVALKVTLREAQRHPNRDDQDSWITAALAAGVEEVLTRLYLRPGEIKDRELIDLVTKLARLRTGAPAPGAVAIPVGGKAPVAFQRITETYLALPEDERERMKPLYEQAIERAKAAIPA